LSHYNCFLAEQPKREKTGFLDIETSALRADWGIIITYAILDYTTGKVLSRAITMKELMSDKLDKQVVTELIKDIDKFDRIITYYGTRFDVPFIRTRAVHHGMKFLPFGAVIHNDAYYMVRNRFLLSRNRLENAEETLIKGKKQKTRWLHQHWIRALQGNKASLDYILDHNIKDVQILKKVYNKVIDYSRITKKSI